MSRSCTADQPCTAPGTSPQHRRMDACQRSNRACCRSLLSLRCSLCGLVLSVVEIDAVHPDHPKRHPYEPWLADKSRPTSLRANTSERGVVPCSDDEVTSYYNAPSTSRKLGTLLIYTMPSVRRSDAAYTADHILQPAPPPAGACSRKHGTLLGRHESVRRRRRLPPLRGDAAAAAVLQCDLQRTVAYGRQQHMPADSGGTMMQTCALHS